MQQLDLNDIAHISPMSTNTTSISYIESSSKTFPPFPETFGGRMKVHDQRERCRKAWRRWRQPSLPDDVTGVLANVLVEAPSRPAVCVCRERTSTSPSAPPPRRSGCRRPRDAPRQEAGGHRPRAAVGPVRVTAAGEHASRSSRDAPSSSAGPASRRISSFPA